MEHIQRASHPARKSLSRREALGLLGRGALAGAALSSGLAAQPAAWAQENTAPAEADSKRNAEVYRFEIGDIEALVVADGADDFPPSLWLPAKGPGEVTRALRDDFRPTERAQIFFQFLVLRRGSETVAIDAGFGASPLGLPTAGRWLANLRAAGVSPESITAAIITHAHPDHLGGFLDSRQRPILTRAAHFIAPDERGFWLNSPDLSRSLAPADVRRGLISEAQSGLDALKEQLQPLGAGRLLGMIEALPAPGHTPGMRALRIRSRGQSLVHLADIAHHDVLSLRHPSWLIAFDGDARQAAATRRRFLHQMAGERALCFSNHLPFPGLGHVRATSSGFEWAPQPWQFETQRTASG